MRFIFSSPSSIPIVNLMRSVKVSIDWIICRFLTHHQLFIFVQFFCTSFSITINIERSRWRCSMAAWKCNKVVITYELVGLRWNFRFNFSFRDAVETVLSSRPIGSFLVRRPTSMESSNSFVLSIRVPKYMKRSCVVHYLIDQDELGFRLRVKSI